MIKEDNPDIPFCILCNGQSNFGHKVNHFQNQYGTKQEKPIFTFCDPESAGSQLLSDGIFYQLLVRRDTQSGKATMSISYEEKELPSADNKQHHH